MKFISNLKKIALILFLSLGVFACSDDDDDDVIIIETNTIADYVNENPDYSSLNAALEAADLKIVLDGNTKYTVFAPNNAAFSAFLTANGFANLSEVPIPLLTQILLNHVQAGVIKAADLSTGYIPSSATGEASDEKLSMYINTENGVKINGVSTVTSADIIVDNGVIHAVNSVIGLPDITTFALADPDFGILVSALTADDSFDFVSTLQTQSSPPAPFTVFAPTNQAFADFLTEFNFADLAAIPVDVLGSVLSYHVITEANVRSEDITDGMMVSTFEGGEFTINTGTGVTITDENDRVSNVIATDVQATNGVIHVIDTVLFPDLED